LIQALSTGEKKALYILNVLFEVESRRKNDEATLFIIDDLADSFDYRNKYAIIQYLKDISTEAQFSQIILTHNFDFFRTVQSRFVRYNHCLMALKDASSVKLVEARGIKNPFITDWKPRFFTDGKMRIASIPFMRNILEYTKGPADPGYIKLTSLLHWKLETASIDQAELDRLFSATFEGPGSWPAPTSLVWEDIHQIALECLDAEAGINFENKIVLSIAIRLEAERFMTRAIDNPVAVAALTGNQTGKLRKLYRDTGHVSSQALEAIDSVLLMTPENIHLNSFMYEPIIDMSDQHLRDLYRTLLALSPASAPVVIASVNVSSVNVSKVA
jgi:hypothetical protein